MCLEAKAVSEVDSCCGGNNNNIVNGVALSRRRKRLWRLRPLQLLEAEVIETAANDTCFSKSGRVDAATDTDETSSYDDYLSSAGSKNFGNVQEEK